MPLKIIPDRKGSEILYVRGTVRGHRVEESTGTSEQSQAEEFKAKREAELYTESLYGRAVSKTFAQAALSYLEEGGSPRFLDKPLDYFQTTPLSQIGQGEIEAGARKHYGKSSPATRDRQFFTPTCAVLKFAAKRKWCAPLIIERPRKAAPTFRYASKDEADRLFASCNAALRPLVMFLVYTGARVGEALWLDWKQVDLERGRVVFPKTKNGEPRGVPLHSRLVAALANLKHREGCVFRRPDGAEYTPLAEDDINDTSAGTRIASAFKGAVSRAKIAPFRVHDCRHTWASWHYAANRDLIALQKLGGWKSVKMVTRYAHINVDELAHTIERLHGGKSGGASSIRRKRA